MFTLRSERKKERKNIFLQKKFSRKIQKNPKNFPSNETQTVKMSNVKNQP